MDLSKRLSENMIIHDVLQREKEKMEKEKNFVWKERGPLAK